ncbi:CD5 protein, partial [Rhinopomastus cyanomelas]|nr:CD5 protein [Rhinopomastus cyanomelas]
VRLTGSGCRCAGILELNWEGGWSGLCAGNLSEAGAGGICRRLGCGSPVAKSPRLDVPTGRRLLRCPEPVTDPSKCRWALGNCSGAAFLACGEPSPRTTPAATATPPVATGPPRLRLVDGESGCSGFVELHRQGLWGAVATSLALGPQVATRICQAVGCGSAIDGHGQPEPRGGHLPVRWEVAEACRSPTILDCFNRTSARGGRAPAFISCSGSQPRAARRLAAGPTPCEGDVELFHEGRWRVLCDSGPRRRHEWGRQLCRELRCGNLSASAEIREPPAAGVTCGAAALHLCRGELGVSRSCSRARVVCQDSQPRPAGPAAGTVVSICLALLLLGVLLLVCGPPGYRRVMKRISRKKQRQWIGPTGLSHTVSFHRNSTVAQRLQRADNDYTEPPKKSSHLSAYPALEGASRAHNPLGASDSDSDPHSARRV